jgi:hypothetical protein
MPDPVRKKNKDGTIKSDVWWLRKKVPRRYRALVGHGEVWRSLETTDRKTAILRCNKLSADLDKDWADRLRAAEAAGRTAALPAPAMTDWDLSGLQRLAHNQGREAQIRRPPPGSRFGLGTGVRDSEEDDIEREYDEADMDEFLSRNAYVLNAADRTRFLPMFVEARREVHKDLTRAARLKDYSESDAFARNAPSPSKQIDFPAAFEFYCDKAGIKGGASGGVRRSRPSAISSSIPILGE